MNLSPTVDELFAISLSYFLASQSHWPQIQFDASMTEHDDAWSAERRESWGDIRTRVDACLAWLVHRNEDRIAVVTHGVWLEALLRTYSPATLGESGRVHNCDAFSCQIVSKEGRFVRISQTQHIAGSR